MCCILEEVSVTRFSLWLVAITASFSLAASQSQQEKQKSKYWPFEVQIGASLMDYNSHDATYLYPGGDGTGLTREFTSKGPRLAPAIRFSVEPICFSFGALVLSAGYRFQNDVPLEVWSDRNAKADLKHKSQVQLGALLRFDVCQNLDFGIGVDARNDWMEAARRYGSLTENSIWRPWLRANARYLFDKGTNFTPFVGIEGALALTKGDEINSSNYYRDYFINTGDAPLGALDLKPSPDSFTRGHAPVWEVALVVGLRFGRSGCGAAPAPIALPITPKAPEKVAPPPPPPPATLVEPEKVEPPPPVAEPEKVAPPPPPATLVEPEKAAPPPPPPPPPPPVKEATVVDVEGVRIHFATNGYTDISENRALVRSWAAKYKNAVEPSAIVIVGHTDRTGAWEHNRQLSVRRANTLASYLRAEGINVPAANISGRSWDEPIADNSTPEGLAKNRRAEFTINGAKYNVKSVMEGKLYGVK